MWRCQVHNISLMIGLFVWSEFSEKGLLLVVKKRYLDWKQICRQAFLYLRNSKPIL